MGPSFSPPPQKRVCGSTSQMVEGDVIKNKIYFLHQGSMAQIQPISPDPPHLFFWILAVCFKLSRIKSQRKLITTLEQPFGQTMGGKSGKRKRSEKKRGGIHPRDRHVAHKLDGGGGGERSKTIYPLWYPIWSRGYWRNGKGIHQTGCITKRHDLLASSAFILEIETSGRPEW